MHVCVGMHRSRCIYDAPAMFSLPVWTSVARRSVVQVHCSWQARAPPTHGRGCGCASPARKRARGSRHSPSRSRCCAHGSKGQSRLIVKLTRRTGQTVGRAPCFQRVGLRTAIYSAPAVPRMPSRLHDSDARGCRVVYGGGIRSKFVPATPTLFHRKSSRVRLLFNLSASAR